MIGLASLGHIDDLELLLKHGADPDARTRSSITPYGSVRYGFRAGRGASYSNHGYNILSLVLPR
jgi:hypothetical protein